MANDAVPLSSIPLYLRNASPVPADKRAPWYMNTAPTYAGIFLWIAYYDQLAGGLELGSLSSLVIGAIIAGAACHLLFYYVPGMLGMRTGLPLYIVGTSTFGTKGGYFIPGIFMGLLQIGWYSVATYYSTKFILNGFGQAAITPYGVVEKGAQADWSLTFIGLAFLWGYLFAIIGALGIGYVARVSQFFPIVPVILLIIGAVQAVSQGDFEAMARWQEKQKISTEYVGIASMFMVQMIVGFFGTAGAVGADFCANNRDQRDVKWGGIAGIWIPSVFAASLAILTVAGARGAGLTETFLYGDALKGLNMTDGQPNFLARTMLLLFAIGSMAPACFCSFIIGNSLSTMLGRPRARIPITLAGATIGILIAITGASAKLAPYFGLIGASFGPVIGAMIADYFLNGGKWAGPREGINWAGYGAWIIGFLVGMSNNAVVNQTILGIQDKSSWILAEWHPTGVYSLLVGIVVYVVLARVIGLPARLEGVVQTVDPEATQPASNA